MASKIQAVDAYCPRIKLGKTAGMDEVVPYMADRTGLNEGTIFDGAQGTARCGDLFWPSPTPSKGRGDVAFFPTGRPRAVQFYKA